MKGRCFEGKLEQPVGVVVDSDMVVDGGAVHCVCVVVDFCCSIKIYYIHTPREDKPTPPTPTSHPTENITIIQNIQNNQPTSEQLTSTTTTHYNQPIHNALTSTCTKLHTLLQCTTPIHYKPNTNLVTCTDTQEPSRNYHLLK